MTDLANSQYLGVFSIAIININYHFLLALSLVVMIIMSLVIVAGNNVTAQTLETITEQRKAFENNPQIIVGSQPIAVNNITTNNEIKAFENNPQIIVGSQPIAVNNITNKIYVTNTNGGTVSVIDSNSGSVTKNIGVGTTPVYVAVDSFTNRIYVANEESNTVSVLDGNNDSVIGQIFVGNFPTNMVLSHVLNGTQIYVSDAEGIVSVIDTSSGKKDVYDIPVGNGSTYMAEGGNAKIYVADGGDNTVYAIDVFNVTNVVPIAVGYSPTYMAVDPLRDKIYVANTASNTVSVIDTSTDKKEPHDITVGKGPTYMAEGGNGKIYVANTASNTVSVIDTSTNKKEPHDITVGKGPGYIAVNHSTGMIYVVNEFSNTVSVIDGFSDKVAAGVTLNIHPGNSGTILCNKKEYPTNIYLYIGAGTSCTAQHNKDFEFSGWVENLNGNSTIPLNTSANSTNSTSLLNSFLSTLGIIKPNGNSPTLTVNRYGTFTANFIPIPPAIPPEFLYLLVGIILSSLFGWSIPSIMGRVKERTQRKYLKECINQIGKLDKNAIEEKIIGYYVDGKINEDHRQLLKDKISEYYENVNK
jgi:YVTN family beta-propeller protein